MNYKIFVLNFANIYKDKFERFLFFIFIVRKVLEQCSNNLEVKKTSLVNLYLNVFDLIT